MSSDEKTLFGMKVRVNAIVPPGEVWLVGPPRIVNGVEVRDSVRITNIEVSPGAGSATAPRDDDSANGGK